MSLTKRHIENLTEAAQCGDEIAQRTLENAGLWESDEAWLRKTEEYFYSVYETDIEDEPQTPEEIDEIIEEHLRWGL